MRKRRSTKHEGLPRDPDGVDRRHRDVDVDRVLRADSADAFIRHPDDGPIRLDDELAETLAEEFVHSATSGEEQTEEALDQVVPEEIGGPFIETSGSEEFADGIDESNPADAEAEPLPRVVGGLSERPKDE